jgi:hypothetical protein
MTRLLFFIALSFMVRQGFGQNSEIINQSNWQVNIAYGPSIPIGKFKNTDIEPFFREQNGFTFIDGFYKKDNGFAKVGYQISADVKKRFTKRLSLNIEFSYSENELEKEVFDNSLVEKNLADRVDYMQEPYQVTSIIPSIAYSIYQKGRSDIALSLGYGWSQMEYPFYRAELFPEDSGIFFGQVNRLEDVQSGVFQLGINFDQRLSKRFDLTVSSTYRSSDFEYDSVVTQIPGGSTINERVDEVNVRAVSLQLGLSYSFGKRD